MRCIVEGKIFDTENSQRILTCRDAQHLYEYYKTAKGNFVLVKSPAPEIEAISYVPSYITCVISEDLMKSVLGMHDLNMYERIFGVEDLETL